MMAFTVISFMVRVPVLSGADHGHRRVSTVGSLRIIARLRAARLYAARG